jgi:hypothetical protein
LGFLPESLPSFLLSIKDLMLRLAFSRPDAFRDAKIGSYQRRLQFLGGQKTPIATPYNVLILMYPIRALTTTTVILPAGLLRGFHA